MKLLFYDGYLTVTIGQWELGSILNHLIKNFKIGHRYSPPQTISFWIRFIVSMVVSKLRASIPSSGSVSASVRNSEKTHYPACAGCKKPLRLIFALLCEFSWGNAFFPGP